MQREREHLTVTLSPALGARGPLTDTVCAGIGYGPHSATHFTSRSYLLSCLVLQIWGFWFTSQGLEIMSLHQGKRFELLGIRVKG